MLSRLCVAGPGADIDSAYNSAHKQKLNTSGNAQAPISKLPAETMCRIFRFCAPSPENHNLAFSQVCTWWRELALCDPYLWRTPILCRPKLASMMLSRAKGVPLLVENEGDKRTKHGDVYLGTIETALRQSVASFRLAARISDLRKFMELLMNKSFRTLEHLHITRTVDFTSRSSSVNSYYLIFPTQVLQTLYLLDCAPDPSNSGQFSALVNLHIDLSGLHERKLNIDVMVRLLRGSPNLETLALRDALDSDTADFASEVPFAARPDRLPQLCLQRLQSLQLHDSLCSLLLVTSALDFPSLGELRINMNSANCAEDQTLPLLQRLIRKLAAHTPWSGDVRRISYDVADFVGGVAGLQVDFQDATDDTLAADIGATVAIARTSCFSATLTQIQSPSIWDVWPSFILGCFSLQQLHHVTVESIQGMHCRHIRAVLGLVPQTISEIELHGYAFLEFMRSISPAHSPPPFPQVKEVRIRNADFTTAYTMRNGELKETLTLRHLDLFASVLATWVDRRRLGLKVIFSGCAVLCPVRRVFAGMPGIEVEESYECVVSEFDLEDEDDEYDEYGENEDEDDEDEEDDGDEDEDDEDEDEDENDGGEGDE